MFSWKTTRTFCAILLLLPIIHLTFLVSRELLAALDISPMVWAGEVDAYTHADESAVLPDKPIVVLGGRRVKLWHGLEGLLAPEPVLMRGVGEATVNDISYYHSQLVGAYEPQAVILLPGASEFHIRDSKSADELVEAIAQLVALDLTYDQTRRFYILAPLKTPLLPRDNDKIDEVVALLGQWAAGRDQVVILDANPVLAKGNGAPNPDFFRMDGLNLNEQGYLRLSMLVRNQLLADKTVQPATAGSY